jgi:hypothetical protein
MSDDRGSYHAAPYVLTSLAILAMTRRFGRLCLDTGILRRGSLFPSR